MKLSFKSVVQLRNYFDTEDKCKQLLALQRWNNSPVCPRCKSDHVYVTNRGYKCAGECKKKFTVLTGTMFENTKIKLRYWFEAIYRATSQKKGVSSHQLARDLGVTQKTAWFMLHRIREMITAKNPAVLQGTVEVDETYVGGETKNKHAWERRERRKKGTGMVHMTPVMGFVERGGRLQLVVIHDTHSVDGTIAKPLVRYFVDRNALLITDGLGAYKDLNKEYHHEVVNHRNGEYGRGPYNTNTIEGAFSIFKRGIIGIYHYISVKHMQRYCNEFSFRYSTRQQKDTDRFVDALKNIPDTRLTYRQLIKDGRQKEKGQEKESSSS